ncbi:MAG: hypothetical protein ACKOFW_01355, partial [Planctomycetaceae bacterium]
MTWLVFTAFWAFSTFPSAQAEEAPPLWRSGSGGEIVEGRLQVDAQGEWRLVIPQSGESIAAQRAGRLHRVAPARVRPTVGLPLRIDLPGATGWPAGWVGSSLQQASLQPWGGAITKLPWRAVHSLRQPAGEVTVQFHANLGGAKPPEGSVWTDQSGTARPPVTAERPAPRTGWRVPVSSSGVLLRSVSAARAGGVSVALRISDARQTADGAPRKETSVPAPNEPPGDPAAGVACTLEFLFGEQAPGEGLVVACEAAGPRASAAEPWRLSAAPPVEWQSGWHVLELQFDAQRTLVLSDNLWVARAVAPQAGLREVRIVSANSDSRLVTEVDSLRQFVAVDLLAPPRWPAARDTLWLDAGDEVPLDLLDQAPPPELGEDRDAAQRKGEELSGANPPGGVPGVAPVNEQANPPWGSWNHIRGFVAGPRTAESFPEEAVPRVRIGLSATQGLVKEPGGMLEGQALGLRGDELRVAHAWLGELALPLTELETVEFLDGSVRQRLEPAPHHLGNNRRPGWRVPLPEGSTWSLSYRREADGPRAARVALTLVEHELLPLNNLPPQDRAAGQTGPPAPAPALPARLPAGGAVSGLVKGNGLPPLRTVVTLDD